MASPATPYPAISPADSSILSWDDRLPSTDAPSRLRLICSYGGRIVPRPNTKSLRYLGGDSRLLSVDRRTSLADLKSKLSLTLLSGRPFALKYQLPDQDLDALVSIANDDDLLNMIDEYDRLGAGPSLRLRLFLFPAGSGSATASSVGSLLDEDLSGDSWFVDAINNGSPSVDSLLGLEDGEPARLREPEVRVMMRSVSSGKIGRSGQESPVMEKASSFGSTSSAPALSDLRPVAVRTEKDRTVTQNCGAVGDGDEQRLEKAFRESRGLDTVNSSSDSTGSPLRSLERVFSECEKSDLGGRGVMKALKAEHPAQVDSFVSDFGSRAVYSNANSDLKQETVASSIANYQNPMSVTTNYAMHVMQDEQLMRQQSNPQFPTHQQYIPLNPHYLHHQQQPTGTMLAIPSYYHPMAAHQIQQSQQIPPHYDAQLSMYYLPARQNPGFHFTSVSTAMLSDPNSAAVTRVPLKPDLPANAYRPVSPAVPSPCLLQQPMIHVAPDQSNPSAGIGYHVMQQHQAYDASAALANYGYGYSTIDSIHPQLYYSQATSASAMTPQLKTVTSGVDSREC